MQYRLNQKTDNIRIQIIRIAAANWEKYQVREWLLINLNLIPYGS